MELTELLEIAQKERASKKPVQIRCCTAAGCLSANSQAVKQRLEDAVTAENLDRNSTRFVVLVVCVCAVKDH